MQAKKSLGQHFLKSEKAIKTITEISGARPCDLILEIGPGKGILTESLLRTGANVTSVEKDDLLIPILEEKFKNEITSGRLKLVHADILDFDFGEKNYKLVANIPYYITGQILRKFLGTENQPRSMTLLVQKEVAERIVAKDGKESLLSLSVKAYGEPKYIEKVPAGAFQPAPEVDSAVICISDISKKRFVGASEEKFFDLIHAGFSHKRKQILPNLSAVFGKEKTSEVLEKIKISPKTRAEDIAIEKWIELTKVIK